MSNVKTSFFKLLVALNIICAMQAGAATIEQTVVNSSSGGANFGQIFELDSGIFAQDQTLDSITFYKGNTSGGGGDGEFYVDIYEIGTATLGSLNFSTGDQVGNLNYLGSSTNEVDYASAGSGSTPGDALTWNFSGITLATDVQLFAVFSEDAADGDHIGASLNIKDTSGGSMSFTNITDALSGPMFNSDAPGYDIPNQDNFYSISVTAVPEPSSFALLMALGFGGWVAMRRQRG